MSLTKVLAFAVLGLASGYAGRRRSGPSPGPAPHPSPGPAPPPLPLNGNILYHLFESKYTGLGNRNAGDFKGDMAFIFLTFTNWQPGNPEASIDKNIIEMSEVNVTGWGEYEACNAPGCTGHHICPANNTHYCCSKFGQHGNSTDPDIKHNATSLPGLVVAKHTTGTTKGGWWLSFPFEAEGTTWTQKRLRRINGKCLGDAWRNDAGGCSSCGEALDECVATCIQAALTTTALLQKTWDRVFSDPNECPEVPPPSASTLIV